MSKYYKFMSILISSLFISIKGLQLKRYSSYFLPILLLNHQFKMFSTNNNNNNNIEVYDEKYPGTAVVRLNNVHKRVRSLTKEQLNDDWINVRKHLLWAGGLKGLLY